MNPKKPRALCRNGCGKPVNQYVAVYCSGKCQMEFQRQRRVETFLRGEYPAPPYSGGHRFVRAYLGKVLGEKCSRCGWSETNPVTERVPLEIEHIDGNWRNNRPENLTLLCPNCHSLTPTYKALNKGRGRDLGQETRMRRPKPPT